ncbi:MAG: hypothetical protein ACF8NJ_04220 [Phycisphaerales bacterium JB038]
MVEAPAPEERGRYCRGCGYRLDGLGEHRCPECGRAFDPDRPGSFRFGRATDAGRFRRLSVLLPTGYAAVLFLLVYSAWGASYLALGQLPEAYLDHPCTFSWPILWLALAAQWFAFLGLPMAVFVGVLWFATCCVHRWFRWDWLRAGVVSIGMALLVGAVWSLLDVVRALRWVLSL